MPSIQSSIVSQSLTYCKALDTSQLRDRFGHRPLPARYLLPAATRCYLPRIIALEAHSAVIKLTRYQ